MQKARLQKQRLPIAFLLLSFSYPVFSVSLFLSHIWPKSLLWSSHLNNNNKNGFHNTFFFVNICSLVCFTQAPTLLEFPAFLAALLAVPVGPRSCGGRKRGEKERGKKNASILQEGTTVPQFLQPPPSSDNAPENHCLSSEDSTINHLSPGSFGFPDHFWKLWLFSIIISVDLKWIIFYISEE